MTRPDLWLARHGETDWSASGHHTGRTDLPLNANGRKAAAALADVLAGEKFELVLTSPLQRARQTCELAGFADHAEIDPDLMEWDYGDYEGITTDEIRLTRPGWNIFVDGCPNGESLNDVAARADAVIARIQSIEGRALVFGHGHALRILAARWIELDPIGGSRLVLGTATVNVLSWERETPVIRHWNAS